MQPRVLSTLLIGGRPSAEPTLQGEDIRGPESTIPHLVPSVLRALRFLFQCPRFVEVINSVSSMPFLPDYGKALLRSGVSPNFESIFYTIIIDHISVVAPGEFTTLLNMNLEGVEHALSLDFGREKLDLILELAQPSSRMKVQSWLRGLNGVSTIQLDEPITFGASALLGKEQQAEKERYIPLIIQRVFPA
jgi:hypothetical protein